MRYDPLCRIDVYSHFFTVTRFSGRIAGILYRFSRQFTKFDFIRRGSRFERVPGKIFGAINQDKTEFRFHIGQLKLLLKEFEKEWIDSSLYETYLHDPPKPLPITFSIKEHFVLREQQIQAVEFVTAPDDENSLRSRFISAATGTGKSVMALKSIEKFGTKTIYGVLPKYIEKTAGDIVKDGVVDPKKVVTIQGGDQLKSLIVMCKEGRNPYYFAVISLKTLQLWYKAYQQCPELTVEEYGCHPHELAGLFGAGQCVVDEAHEHLYSVYQFMIYSNVEKFIGLSGTMLSRDPFIEKMQKIMFPSEIRFENIKMKKYIKAYAYSYNFFDYERSRVRTTERGSTTYSQTAFEESIINNKWLLPSYLKLVEYLVRETYIKDYRPGDRCIVFAGRIEMCTLITEHLKKALPNLVTRRFAENDPYVNLMSSDIRVTTIQSGGTAHDIPKLRAAVMTTNIQSPQANLQALGRLRELPDRDVKFAYMFSEQIQKQVDYHQEKKELFKDRIASLKEFRCPIMV